MSVSLVRKIMTRAKLAQYTVRAYDDLQIECLAGQLLEHNISCQLLSRRVKFYENPNSPFPLTKTLMAIGVDGRVIGLRKLEGWDEVALYRLGNLIPSFTGFEFLEPEQICLPRQLMVPGVLKPVVLKQVVQEEIAKLAGASNTNTKKPKVV